MSKKQTTGEAIFQGLSATAAPVKVLIEPVDDTDDDDDTEALKRRILEALQDDE